jgi:hypothetical protein
MIRRGGPINMCFEIPMYNVSNLQVRYLRVAERLATRPIAGSDMSRRAVRMYAECDCSLEFNI